jgi:hypothetical protein
MSNRQRSVATLAYQAPNTFSPFRTGSGVLPGLSVEEKAFALFQPDILLPSQYFATTRRRYPFEPERRLMMAVLQDAVDCFQRYAAASHPAGQALFQEAEEWIWEEKNNRLFAFKNICEVLGFDPEYLRTGLMDWKDRMIKGMAERA